MEKMYGFKEKDVIGLAELIKNKGEKSLTDVFNEYSLINGKAKGTVRNLYYALAKKSATDKDFCQKYLDGKMLEVSQIVQFDGEQERELIRKILLAKHKGKSVRSQIMILANGDAKLALRYQNKYRNALKNKPQLISEIVSEIKRQGQEISMDVIVKPNNGMVSSEQFDKLKNEIDNLVLKISSKIRKENQFLKERIAVLESENLKLSSMLYGKVRPIDTKKYFDLTNKKEFIN